MRYQLRYVRLLPGLRRQGDRHQYAFRTVADPARRANSHTRIRRAARTLDSRPRPADKGLARPPRCASVNVVAVWMNGDLYPDNEARISIFDHGLVVGDGVFETIKVANGQPFALTRHLARLARSAAGTAQALPESRHGGRRAHLSD